MFTKILFAFNVSTARDAAAKIAFELAQKYAAELTLLHVFEVPSRGASQLVNFHTTGREAEPGPDYVDWIKQKMQTTCADLADKYATPVYAAKAGIPSTEILGLARDMDADCIIMGTHARQDDTAAERFRGIVGNTTQNVAQQAKCPVMIISRPCETSFWYFNQIIFGTDFSKASLAAFQFAYKMARHIGCKLHLFHALDMQVSQAGIPPGQKFIETRIAEAKAEIQEQYVSLMDNFDNFEITVWEGIPYVELLKYAREISGDLIVMAHHTRELAPDEALFGSTVEQVVLRSACPVVSVKRPDNF